MLCNSGNKLRSSMPRSNQTSAGEAAAAHRGQISSAEQPLEPPFEFLEPPRDFWIVTNFLDRNGQ